MIDTSKKEKSFWLFLVGSPVRSKKWAENCQRPDLLDKSPEQLYKYYRICGKHFDTSSTRSVSYLIKEFKILLM